MNPPENGGYMKGISKCKKCGKEFKWYRNDNQGAAKYCSKKCKDKDHGSWSPRSARQNKWICEICAKEFSRRITLNRPTPKCCSKKCDAKRRSKLGSPNPFNWKKATTEDKKERLRQKFEEKVIRKEGCWDWKGCAHKSGYLPFNGMDNKWDMAHRISYFIHYGEIPSNLWVLHHCDNPRCTNPKHLYLGTPKKNSEDREKRERRPLRKGEASHLARLTEEKVRKIKKMLQLKIPMSEIARQFKCSSGAIHAIKDKRSWKHVSIEESDDRS